jgi:hypothetical protein
MPPQTHSPAVLVIDDDRAITGYIRKSFHNDTSIGVLVANDLPAARKLLDAKEIKIDAVLADIFFDKGTNDPDNNLLDGIDILRYSTEKRPNAEKYVISVWANREQERAKTTKERIDIKEWFHKMFYDPREPCKTPWAVIERNLIKKRLAEDATLAERVRHIGAELPDSLESVSEYARALRFPLRTYIQTVDSDSYVVKKPIEVICLEDSDGQIQAHALGVGLLVGGHGETVEEAVEELAQFILDQAEALANEPAECLRGYAALVKDRLASYVSLGHAIHGHEDRL